MGCTGFLNDKSLLGEHRELHGIVSVVRNHKRGYSRHPETLRWSRFLESLAIRHALLAVFHMWGYVSGYSTMTPTETALCDLFTEIQVLALAHNVTCLIQSTALGELAYWCKVIGNSR